MMLADVFPQEETEQIQWFEHRILKGKKRLRWLEKRSLKKSCCKAWKK